MNEHFSAQFGDVVSSSAMYSLLSLVKHAPSLVKSVSWVAKGSSIMPMICTKIGMSKTCPTEDHFMVSAL